MTALGIDCSDREPETWFDQRPSHPVRELEIENDICWADHFNDPADDPRTDEERELDRLEAEVRETINSVRPGG